MLYKLCANNKDPRRLFRTVVCPTVLDLNIPGVVKSSSLVTMLQSFPVSWRWHLNLPNVSKLALSKGSINNSETKREG